MQEIAERYQGGSLDIETRWMTPSGGTEVWRVEIEKKRAEWEGGGKPKERGAALPGEQRGITRWNDPNRNRRTQEVPFIAAYSHFPRKNTRFRAPVSSPTRIPRNIHAAITMRFAAWRV